MSEPLTEKMLLSIVADVKTGCWLWPRVHKRTGYGYVYDAERYAKIWSGGEMAHRAFYKMFRGPIGKRLTVDHLCRVRHCVNPSHMRIVDNRTNVLAGIGPIQENAKKTTCIKGHPLDRIQKVKRRGVVGYRRVCRTCARLWSQTDERRAKHRINQANYLKRRGAK